MSPSRVLPPEDRAAYAGELAARYRAGESVRVLARSTGRSYGWVYRLLTEAGVAFRPRGGNEGSAGGGRG